MYEYYFVSKTVGIGEPHITRDIHKVLHLNELNARAAKRGYGIKWIVRRIK